MKRILIIGCGGAGKSTLGKKLHKITNLKLIHLDQYYWKSHWVPSQSADWEKQVQQFADLPEWIIDGNYGSTMDIRIAKADTIIFLHYPTLTCLLRVIKRTLTNYGQARSEMNPDCKDRFTFEFLKYVTFYNRTRAPLILKKLEKASINKKVYIFNNDLVTNEFLNMLKKKKTKHPL